MHVALRVGSAQVRKDFSDWCLEKPCEGYCYNLAGLAAPFPRTVLSARISSARKACLKWARTAAKREQTFIFFL